MVPTHKNTFMEYFFSGMRNVKFIEWISQLASLYVKIAEEKNANSSELYLV